MILLLRRFSGFLQLGRDHFLNARYAVILRRLPVDEHGRDATNPSFLPVLHVSGDQLLESWISHVLVELLQIEPYFLGELLDLGIVQVVEVLEQGIVKLPELALGVRRQGGDGCLHGKFVAAKGEILEDELDLLRVFLQHLLEERIEPRTVRSLVVAEDGNGYRGVLRAFEGKAGNIDFKNRFPLNDLQRLSGPAAED
jgi:hypothetical protein